MVKDDQTIQKPEPDTWNHKKVYGSNTLSMIIQEGLPGL